MQGAWLARLFRLMDSPIGAVLGGACYGAWALFVNLGAGWPQALRSGSSHWAMSAAITYGSVLLMRRLFSLSSDPVRGALLSTFGSLLLTYAVLLSVHALIGTPRILLTLAPGLLPTIAFAVTFSGLLLRESRQAQLGADPRHGDVNGAHRARA